ncbi:cTAGE family member 5 isoform 2-T2 [Spinachia spinachia]
MAFSQRCKMMWGTGIVFVILPHFILGLLSDYKICGDTECESLLSRAQATRDQRGKDCRFLSFRRGETIFVYQKLTGKREDLWAGSINKQFGYFPKEAVREEQVYATLEKVVETQKSDFFCTDEFGYLIDSSHLDDGDDQKNQVSESTQTSPFPRDISAESPSTPEDPSTESPILGQDTPPEEDESKSAGDAASRTDEGAQGTPAALREQGGSAPSSSWLGSSVTGWLGLGEEEEASSFAEGGKKEETTENRAEASAASTITATMTGWLGFGGETKTDDEGEDDKEPTERFKGRKISLNLEGSQLHEEEKKETGMLDWLGSGLSSTLRFGLTNQDSEHKSTPERDAKETDREEEEHLPLGSWLDMGIKDILGFGEEKRELVERAESGFKETEENKTFEHLTDLDSSQSQPALTREVRTETSNESKGKETAQDLNVPSETQVNAENDNMGSSDSTKEPVSTEDAATMVDLEEVSPQTNLERPSQTEGGLSLMPNSIKEKEEDSVSDNRKGEKYTAMPNRMAKSIDNGAEGNNRETGGDESRTASGNDQDLYTQSGTNIGSDSSSVVLNINSEGQSVDKVEDKTGGVVEEGPENPDQTDDLDESIDGPQIKISPGSHEGVGNGAETSVLHREILTADDQPEQSHGREASGGKTCPSLSTGAVEERHEPVSNVDEPLLGHGVGNNDDSSDSQAETDSLETETLRERGEAGEAKEGSSQEFLSLLSTNKNCTYENASVEKETQKENRSAVPESMSPHLQQRATQSVGDEHKSEILKTIPETQRDGGKNNLQPVQSETTESKKYNLNESGVKSAILSQKEIQTEEVRSKEQEKEVSKELKGEEKQQEVREIKEEEKEKDGLKIKEEEKNKDAKEIKEEKKQEEVREIKEEESEKEGLKIKEEEKKKEEKEIKEEKKQDEVREIKKEESEKEGLKIKEEEKKKEAKEIKEEKKQEEVREIKEEEKEKEGLKIKEEEKKKEAKEIKEEKKQEEVREIKEEEKEKERLKIKEEEKNKDAKEIKEEKKQEEVREIKEEEKEKEGLKIKEEEKKKEAKEIKEEKKQEEGKKIKEEETQEEVKEIKEEGKCEEGKETREEEKQKGAKEIKQEKKQEDGQKMKEEEKREEGKKTKEEKKQTGMEDIKEGQNRGEKEHSNGEGEKEEIEEMEKEEKKQEVSSREEEQGDVKKLKQEGKRQETEMFKEERKLEELEEKARDKEKVMAGVREVEEMESVEHLRWNEEQGILKYSKELFSEASKDRFLQDINENDSVNLLSSIKEGRVATVQQNPVADHDQTSADRIAANPSVPFKGVEKDEDVIKVEGEKDENKDDGAVADEGKNNHLPHSDESSKLLSLGQTTRNREGHQRLSSEAHNTELEYTGTASNGVSAEKETEHVHSDHSAVMSEETSRSDGHNVGTPREPPSVGVFGLFKSTLSFFGSPVTKTKGPNESAPSLGSNTGETTNEQAPPPPEQEVDTSHDSNQVYLQGLRSDFPATASMPRPRLPLAEAQRSHQSPTQTHSHPVESPLQTKPPTRHIKSLLGHMSADEATILMELFGRHKLQFLDYALGSAGTEANHPDGDDSILLDIERLLGHYREALVAPSMGLQDKEETRTLIALQKLETLLASVRETFSSAGASSVRESYPTHGKTPPEELPPGSLKSNAPRDEWIGEDKDRDGGLSTSTAKQRLTEDERRVEEGERRERERRAPEPLSHIQPASPHPPEGMIRSILEFAQQIGKDSISYMHAARELLIWLTSQVVSSLPDDIRPGPDLYGLSWEPVIVSSLVGLVTMLLFTCRCYSSVKSRMYRSKERRMAEQVAQLLDEKCKVLEDLSKCQQEYDGLERTLKESGVLAETQKTEHLEVKARQLGHAKRELDRDLEQLKDQLDQQREHRIEQERKIALLEETIKTSEEETKDLLSQDEQAQTTLKVYSMNMDRLQGNLETAGEEKALLQESNAQLRQQVEGWAERVSELEAEMSRCEVAHGAMLQDVATKDERIMSLTDRLLGMKAWDSDLEEGEAEAGGQKETANGREKADTPGHLQKVQKLIYAAKLNADLKAVDEDKDRLFAKLNDEVKAKEELQESIREMDNEKISLQSDSEQYQDQVQRLQQKLQIMTEMYQENELKLHRLLTVEEKERMQKEEKLNKADKNIALAMEELSNYRQRAGEMEEELEKTKQSYQAQISAHEKKAHNNWLAARAADRDLADIRRENSLFRQKLTDTQFKLDALDKDPYALDSLARPLPFRAERSPYGPSPLGRPASETRAFLSPPTLMDGPPARLSPRVGQGEQERSGGPHSDSGSNSPTWERDRRAPPVGPSGPLGPPGYMFQESGGPMYRRPPLGPLGPLHHQGPLHPRGLLPGPPHPADMADGSYRDGPGDLEHRESGPGDRRTPPEADPRTGGAPAAGHPMGPMGGPFPRRGPYGLPPPDFYPTRGPPGPPMLPMWAPPPPGMMFPPRFPTGGPNAPRPYYAPNMRPPVLDGHPNPSMGPLPPQQAVPSLPHSQSPGGHTPPPEDAI